MSKAGAFRGQSPCSCCSRCCGTFICKSGGGQGGRSTLEWLCLEQPVLCLQGCSTALPAARWGQSSSSLSWQQCCTLLSHSFKQYNVASGFLLHYCPRIRAMLQWIPLVLFVKCCLQPCSWPWLSDYMSSNISF